MKNALYALILFTSTCLAQKPKNWITLFDGTNTNELRGYKMESFPNGVWEVKNGAIATVLNVKNVDLITKRRFRNFELEYQWAVDTAANSGVFFHIQERKEMVSANGNSPNWLENFEIQVLDDIHFKDTVKIRSAGSLYDLIRPKEKKLLPIGQFNNAKLLHKNGHVEHWLNGSKVLDFEIGSQALNELIAKSKFKVHPNFHGDKEGHIMFQHHGQRVYFKNIRIREL
ncbi:MAG: DUF1080 domain-containing protein [Bacteroidota bacterium]